MEKLLKRAKPSPKNLLRRSTDMELHYPGIIVQEGDETLCFFYDLPSGILVAESKDDVLGLGTNLFSNRDTLLERDGKELIDDEFLKDSKMMLSLYQGKSYKESLSHYSLPKREQPSLS